MKSESMGIWLANLLLNVNDGLVRTVCCLLIL